MTGRELFERTVYVLCRRKNDFNLSKEYSMDEDWIEGYNINIPREMFEKKHINLLEEGCIAMHLKMRIKYGYGNNGVLDLTPMEITFYAGEYETPIIMYRLNPSITNIYGISRVLTDDTSLVSVVKKIVLPTFRSFSKAVCIKLLERLE